MGDTLQVIERAAKKTAPAPAPTTPAATAQVPSAQPSGATAGGIGRQLAAYVIDSIVWLVPMTLLYAGLEYIIAIPNPWIGVVAAWLILIVAAIGLAALTWWMVRRLGYTIGHRLLGMRIVDARSNEALDGGASLVRLLIFSAVTMVFFGLGGIVATLSAILDKPGTVRTVHDRLAGARVIRVGAHFEQPASTAVSASASERESRELDRPIVPATHRVVSDTDAAEFEPLVTRPLVEVTPAGPAEAPLLDVERDRFEQTKREREQQRDRAVEDAMIIDAELVETAETPILPGEQTVETEGSAAVVTGSDVALAADEAAELRAEAERFAAARAERERAEAERVRAERAEAEAAREEAQRVAAERREAERVEAERVEAERVEAERAAERLEAARLAAERLEAERLEAERLEAERLEAERLAAERLEAERVEAERLEAERVEAERQRAEREHAAAERARAAAELARAAAAQAASTKASTAVGNDGWDEDSWEDADWDDDEWSESDDDSPAIVLADGSRHPFSTSVVLGRSPGASSGSESTLAVDDPRLSRRHLEVKHDGGAFWATDLGSTNGSAIVFKGIEVPLRAGVPNVVRPGATVTLGDSSFTIA